MQVQRKIPIGFRTGDHTLPLQFVNWNQELSEGADLIHRNGIIRTGNQAGFLTWLHARPAFLAAGRALGRCSCTYCSMNSIKTSLICLPSAAVAILKAQ